MGKIKVSLEGTFEDISRVYEFMKYNTKGVSKPVWFSGGDASLPPSSVEFTAIV